LSQQDTGRIINYRIGIRTQSSKECLIQFEQASAAKLIGKRVLWKQGKNVMAGKIVGLHGRNGVVRAKFVHGVPGQAIGTVVELAS
jgi:ribosomal protein L35AE/L33A